MDKLKLKNKFDGSLIYGAKEFQEKTGRLPGNTDKPFGLKIIEKFGDQTTNRIKSKFLELRGCCPLCKSNNTSELFLKHGFSHHLCQDCGFLYVDPILKDDVLMEFYVNYERWHNVLQSEIQQKMDHLKFSYGLDLIEMYAPNRGSLLDVGSGTGHFMKSAKERGWDCLGIEFNQKEIDISINEGLDIVQEEIVSTFFDNKSYSIITMWEVLEHLKDPRAIVRRTYELLQPNGLLFILVPNRDSFVNRILHEKSGSFTPHSHISMFNHETLSNLLIEESFKIVESETIISEINNIINHLEYENAYQGQATNTLNFLTPEFIHENMLGCKLLTIAKKL